MAPLQAGNGLDEAELAALQKWPMLKISKEEVPAWLNVDRSHIPDFVVVDPLQSKVPPP